MAEAAVAPTPPPTAPVATPASPPPPPKVARPLPNPLTVVPNIRDPWERKRMPLMAIATGMKTTLRAMFKKPVTFEYPEVRRPSSDRYRGRLGLELDLCIGCTLCAQACPNGTCFMVDQDWNYTKPDDMAKRFANRKNIYPAVEVARCLYCALCEEACPTGAIHMTPEFELSRMRKDMVYMPEMLQMTEAEIDRLDQGFVKARFDKGAKLIAVNDKERI